MNRFAIVIGIRHDSNEADEVARDISEVLHGTRDLPDAYQVVHFEVHQEDDGDVIEIRGDAEVITRVPIRHAHKYPLPPEAAAAEQAKERGIGGGGHAP